MLLVSAVQIAIGWAWHTAHRARLHWTLKREGSLIAAVAVALIGAADTIRSSGQKEAVSTQASPPRTAAAMSRPVFTEAKPIEIRPVEAVDTIEAVPSPPIVDVAEADPIGEKIMERLGDKVETGSIEGAEPEPPRATKRKPRAIKKDVQRKATGRSAN
jgi:hypothetical protein